MDFIRHHGRYHLEIEEVLPTPTQKKGIAAYNSLIGWVMCRLFKKAVQVELEGKSLYLNCKSFDKWIERIPDSLVFKHRSKKERTKKSHDAEWIKDALETVITVIKKNRLVQAMINSKEAFDSSQFLKENDENNFKVQFKGEMHSLLSLAANKGAQEVLTLVLERNEKRGQKLLPLSLSLNEGNIENAIYLESQGVSFKMTGIDPIENSDPSLLERLLSKGNFTVARWLMTKGALSLASTQVYERLNQHSSFASSIKEIFERGDLTLLLSLKDFFSDLSLLKIEGLSLLYLAVRYDQEELFDTLLPTVELSGKETEELLTFILEEGAMFILSRLIEPQNNDLIFPQSLPRLSVYKNQEEKDLSPLNVQDFLEVLTVFFKKKFPENYPRIVQDLTIFTSQKKILDVIIEKCSFDIAKEFVEDFSLEQMKNYFQKCCSSMNWEEAFSLLESCRTKNLEDKTDSFRWLELYAFMGKALVRANLELSILEEKTEALLFLAANFGSLEQLKDYLKKIAAIEPLEPFNIDIHLNEKTRVNAKYLESQGIKITLFGVNSENGSPEKQLPLE